MPTVPFHAPGITYNGLHSTVNPSAAQVSADLATTKQHFVHVRTYYPQYGGGAVDVGKLAKDVGLNLMLSLFLFDGHPDWIGATTNSSSSRRWHAATSLPSSSATKIRK